MIPGLSLPVPCSSRLAPLWKQCWRQLSPCLWWLHSSVSTGMLSTSFSNGDGTSLADKNPIGPWTIYVCPGCDQPSAFPDEHSHPGHPGGMVKFERIEVGPV